MDEPEEIWRVADFFELLVSRPIEYALAVRDIRRIRYLDTGNSEIGISGAETPEQNQHLSSVHGVFEEGADFPNTFGFICGIEALAKFGAGRKEVFCPGLVTGLVIVAVEMAGMAGYVEGCFFAVFDCEISNIGYVIGQISANKDRFWAGKLDSICDESVHFRIF
jgi:hypothetical protein